MASARPAGAGSAEGPAARIAHKRGHGEGSIDQVRDGLWRGRLMVGYTPAGKPDRRTVYGKTRTEVQKKVGELRRRADAGTLNAPATERQTVASFLARWLEAIKGSIRPRTWQRYADVVRLHLAPELGKHKLAALRPDDIQRLYASKLDAGLSPQTVRYLHAVLHHALNDAIQWGDVPRNVADMVKKPAAAQHEIHPPLPDALRGLLDTATANADPLGTLWTVAVYSGCREGELLGLQWRDVDLDAGAIAIRQTLLSTKAGVPEFGTPKTQRSRRTVTLPKGAVEALRQRRLLQLETRLALGADYAPYDLVFATATGAPLLRRNVHRSFKSALARAGLPATVRFHDLRHAAATLMLAAGVHPKVAAERLGHSDVRMTLNVYTHAVQGLDADAAERLERAVRGPKEAHGDEQLGH